MAINVSLSAGHCERGLPTRLNESPVRAGI